jgi:hypothetical protein
VGDSLRSGGRWGALVAAALCALCGPSQATAASLTELTTVPGRIHDATADRVLWGPVSGPSNSFKHGPLEVRDVASGTDETVPMRADREVGSREGRLTDYGVLFTVQPTGGTLVDSELDEWRPGDTTPAMIEDDSNGFFDDDGNYAIWHTGGNQGPELIRRDLTTGTNITVALDTGNTENDVAPNGDVVYWTSPTSVTPYTVYRWRLGVTTKLSNAPSGHQSTYPRTDGTLTVWRRHKTSEGGSIFFSDGTTETELPDSRITPGINKPEEPAPDFHYRIASNGLIGYIAAEVTQVRTRSPSGTITTVNEPTSAQTSLMGLAPNGQVMYQQGNEKFLGTPGENPFPLGPVSIGPFDTRAFDREAFWQGGRWYLIRVHMLNTNVASGSLLQLDTDTAITKHPEAVTQDTSAELELASTARSPTFECQLDGLPVTCAGGSYSATGLAEGVHTFSAASTDPALAEQDTTPATATWRVDTTAPAAPEPVSPADGQDVKTAALEWSAAGDPGGSGVAAYRVFVDGSERGTTSSTTFTPAGVGDGEHSWFVRAVDGAGNTRDSATRTFTLDTVAPSAPQLLEPPDDVTLAAARPSFSWSAASDSGTGIAGYDVDIDGSATRVGASTTSFSPSSDIGNGYHEWRVVAVDAAGNTTASETRSFDSDTRPPAASLRADPNPALTGQTVRFDAGGSTAGGAALTRFEWDLDGNGSFERDTGTSSATEQTYASAQELDVRVRVSDAAGRSATAAVRLRVTPAPPPGPAGVSIDGGARFTNDPDVTLTLRWPLFATAMLVSNDGGFDDATPEPVVPQRAWQLDSSGAERLPKTVYVRFIGGVAGNDTYQDDIILDEKPPRIRSARLRVARAKHRPLTRRYTITVRAVDAVSGPAQVQVAANRARPSAKRRYASRFAINSRFSPRWIRVVDAAGNHSGWTRLTTR